MEAAGLMTDAGSRAVRVAQANGWWTRFDAVEDLVEPDALAQALAANPAAQLTWNGFPPSARKAMLWWIVGGITAQTQAGRITSIVEKAANGERAKG